MFCDDIPSTQLARISGNNSTRSFLTDLDLFDVAEVDQAEGEVALVVDEAVAVGLARVAGARPGGCKVAVLSRNTKTTADFALNSRGQRTAKSCAVSA